MCWFRPDRGPPVIEVVNLTKKYGEFLAVDRATFSVSKGEIVGFLGPNGAGKTTTMRILTCYMPATEGKATVAAINVDNEGDLAQRFGVASIPTLIVFCDGEEKKRFVGVTSKPDLAGALDDACG